MQFARGNVISSYYIANCFRRFDIKRAAQLQSTEYKRRMLLNICLNLVHCVMLGVVSTIVLVTKNNMYTSAICSSHFNAFQLAKMDRFKLKDQTLRQASPDLVSNIC